MSIISPEIEYVDRATQSIRYLEHGWPNQLCRWHAHEEYELHLITRTRGKAFVSEFEPGSLYLTGPTCLTTGSPTTSRPRRCRPATC